jgi:hypothetical protein
VVPRPIAVSNAQMTPVQFDDLMHAGLHFIALLR